MHWTNIAEFIPPENYVNTKHNKLKANLHLSDALLLCGLTFISLSNNSDFLYKTFCQVQFLVFHFQLVQKNL